MGLQKYWQKRDFTKTPEPRGTKAPRHQELGYVIQKHAATRLHYDFRLELDGVLVSWAIPKGPSLDPRERRLAVHVEDHPVSYGDFEGIIPRGQYGGGTVMLWDHGTWTPDGNPKEMLAKGRLKFHLSGQKLQGGWSLVRMGGRAGEEDRENWLLIKEKDEEARPLARYDITKELPDSVTSQRSLDEIKASPDRVWHSNRAGGDDHGHVDRDIAAGPPPAGRRTSDDEGDRTVRGARAGRSENGRAGRSARPTKVRAVGAKGSGKDAKDRETDEAPTKRTTRGAQREPAREPARSAKGTARPRATRATRTVQGKSTSAGRARSTPLPEHFEPQLATLVKEVPHGDGWIHEIKLDGYRLVARIENGTAQLITRNGNDWTSTFGAVARALEGLGVDSALFDGEVVKLDPEGVSRFQLLQNAMSEGEGARLLYYIFDLLHLDGQDLRRLPLIERKVKLKEVLDRAGLPEDGVIRYSDHVVDQGKTFYQHACQYALEGIISKRADQPYQPGRGKDWLKVKCTRVQELVIGGWTDPSGSRKDLGALLLGYYDKEGQLVFAGKVGTGFTEESLRTLGRTLRKIEQDECPFHDPPADARRRGVHYVRPELVAQIEFTEWTVDNSLRHPSFQGLREDKPAREVTREVPQPLPAAGRGDEERSGEDGSDGDEGAGTSRGAMAGRAARAARGTSSARGARGRRPDPDDEDQARAARPASGRAAGNTRGKRPGLARSRKAGDARDGKAAGENVVAGVTITSPDRVLFPDAAITKLDVARYYETVAEAMLPHVENRPLTLVRCPEGRRGQCFFQKHASESTPDALDRVDFREEKGVRKYLSIPSVSGLVSLVQMGVLEVHVLGAPSDDPEHPDRVVLDLDPAPELEWDRVVAGAREIRRRLAELDLESFLKTTGGKGLHVVVPLTPGRHDWELVKRFSEAIAEAMVRAEPELYVSEASKAKRKGRIFIDWLRNARGATAVGAYSTRAREGCPIAMPVRWEDLGKLDPKAFDLHTVPAIVARREDPWRELTRVRQTITAAIRKKLGI